MPCFVLAALCLLRWQGCSVGGISYSRSLIALLLTAAFKATFSNPADMANRLPQGSALLTLGVLLAVCTVAYSRK